MIPILWNLHNFAQKQQHTAYLEDVVELKAKSHGFAIMPISTKMDV